MVISLNLSINRVSPSNVDYDNFFNADIVSILRLYFITVYI